MYLKVQESRRCPTDLAGATPTSDVVATTHLAGATIASDSIAIATGFPATVANLASATPTPDVMAVTLHCRTVCLVQCRHWLRPGHCHCYGLPPRHDQSG
jgi:hypothetical protein